MKRVAKPQRSSRKLRMLRLPRTAKELAARSISFQNAYAQTLDVISKMRSEHVSLNRAAAETGVDPRTVIRLGKSALWKQSQGRYSAKKSDRLLRVLLTPGPDGMREIAVRGSKQAALIAEHANAVRKYVQTGDARPLRRFRQTPVVTDSGERVSLLTDLVNLDEQANAGVLSFESLYARSA